MRASTAIVQQRTQATTSYPEWGRTTKIPDFSGYKSKSGENENKVFQYLMTGSLGALSAMGAKATIVGQLKKHSLKNSLSGH